MHGMDGPEKMEDRKNTMAATTEDHCIKRRRTTPGSLGIAALPDSLLVNVVGFLPKPSRVIFAVAKSGPLLSWHREIESSMASDAILASSLEQWTVLDFGEIEKSLAEKLKIGMHQYQEYAQNIEAIWLRLYHWPWPRAFTIFVCGRAVRFKPGWAPT